MLEHGNFGLVSGRLSLKRHYPFTYYFQSSFRAVSEQFRSSFRAVSEQVWSSLGAVWGGVSQFQVFGGFRGVSEQFQVLGGFWGSFRAVSGQFESKNKSNKNWRRIAEKCYFSGPAGC